ncbi:Acetyl-CoA acetyltransferase [Candidatus Cyrtobacter comes]|uniref:Acetyl-CoA acetyltransferase n=1 Tax=Candidatus Cyrtobacter comes TaxID=675776 RepID=A0ABU5L924_9RICK|nr:acetyl-CoA C-acetyltransferase [Candidatus Cyrtobacter comes]MDZ5762621.1 Acetyl-CoA acetyltransferase [Candidatus Cyrtobacter comes]
MDVAIIKALRTPIGKFCGGLAKKTSWELGSEVVKNILNDTGVSPKEISEVIMGQVLLSGAGQNPARRAALSAGIPESVPAFILNQVCGSGLRAAAITILEDPTKIIIAGGQESMTNAPFAVNIRAARKMGNIDMQDLMLTDGLMDDFLGVHMGITAEGLAKKYSITRNMQDNFALESQQKASKAQKLSHFKNEIIPMQIDGNILSEDEFIRHDMDLEKLSKLRPAFIKDGGTVTAGNSSGINDGAAAVLLMSLKEAQRRKLEPMAIIRSFEQSGIEPGLMGIAPVEACRKALKKASWSVSDLGLIEASEAFAVQLICVNNEMGWDASKVNVNGGAIALGHPIGASGARILTTLLHEMHRRDVKKSIATLCIGGGMGIAMCLER